MRLMHVALVLTVPGLFVACGDEETTGMEPSNATVDVIDDEFDPEAASVDVGGMVTWEWGGADEHNVTFVDPINGGNAPESTTQETGTYSLTFNTAGTFNYYCTIHGTPTTGMRGSVAVQ